MSSIFSNPTHKNTSGFNGFSIRQHKQFSSSVGHILPVYFDYLKPGDKVECAAVMRTRFQPMVAPAFFGLKEHIDWFFVPLQQIYKPISSLLYGIQDFDTDFLSTTDNSTLPVFNTRYSTTGEFGEVMHSVYTSATTANNDAITADDAVILRCMDLLGIPVKSLFIGQILSKFESSQSSNVVPAIPVWFAAAYQKIWSDHYRLSDWQENNPSLYNFDSTYNSGSASSRFRNCFTLHRAPFNRDYNTYVLPSPVFGSTSYNATNNVVSSINQWLTNVKGVITTAPTNNTDSGSENSNPTSVTTAAGISSYAPGTFRTLYSPDSIRTLFAGEKLLEITRRAGKHYDSQVLAHYGINVPTGLSGESQFIGGFSQDVKVEDVFATAETTNGSELTPLGKMAGKAFVETAGKNLKFESKCEGVLMAVYYAVPEVIYQNVAYDPLNRLVRISDFYQPELDDLGMQPQFNLYRSLLDSKYQDTNVNLNDATGGSLYTATAINAWEYRFKELKSKVNVALGAFIGSMQPWTTAIIPPTGSNGMWNEFTVPSNFLNPVMNFAYSDSVPSSYGWTAAADNSITVAQAQKLYNGIYDRDPLLHDCFFFVNKASKMSKYGLANL